MSKQSEIEVLKKRIEKLESELNQNQESKAFKRLFEKSRDPILIIDGNTFIDCNDATVNFLEYKKKNDILNKNPEELSPKYQPDGQLSSKKAKALIEDTIKYGNNLFDWVHLLNGNKEVWVEVSLTHIPEYGKDRIYCIWRSIHERKKAEANLKLNKERFDIVIKATRDGVYDWNLVTNEIYYSPAWKQMLGYEDHEINNDFEVWENLTRKEDAEKSWKILKDHLEGKIDRFQQEFKMKHKDGHWIDILSRANAIFDEKGKPLRIIGTHLDISLRKRAMKELKESEEKFRVLASSSPSGIYLADKNGSCTYVNSFWLKCAGMEFEEALGTAWMKAIHPDDLQNVQDNWNKMVESQGEWGYEYRFMTKGGKITWVYGTASKIYNNEKEVVGYVGVNIDVTEKKILENELSGYRKHLEQLVQDRTKELEEKNNELERLNKLFVGREYRIKELKSKIAKLESGTQEN